jgi:NitT/TauT family transport system substrate-binding protein
VQAEQVRSAWQSTLFPLCCHRASFTAPQSKQEIPVPDELSDIRCQLALVNRMLGLPSKRAGRRETFDDERAMTGRGGGGSTAGPRRCRPIEGRVAAVMLCALFATSATAACAQDAFKVAVGKPGPWALEGPRLGQHAGIFERHGLTLEIVATSGGGETLQAVISGSADLGVGIGTAPVLRAYAKGAPIRVIGANFTGAGDLYWYVRADSPIRRIGDCGERTTIGFSASGSSSHNVVLAFLRDLGVKGVPTATGTQPATLAQVMSGQIDIGWAEPPFGLKELAAGRIRIIASGNDVPALRTQTMRVDAVNADVLRTRKDAVLRYVHAYRETLGWMFSSPEAVRLYSERVGVPIELAAMTRDKFHTREAMRHDRLSDIDAVMTEAVMLKFLDQPLSSEQLAELIQIPSL